MNLNRREFLFATTTAASTKQDLVSQWKTIARKTDGRVGIAALHLGAGDLVAMNGDESAKSPLQWASAPTLQFSRW